ncbi:CBL-interacting serine/threonine-protein kinase 21 isoform X4 [Sander lucioperca]|uniref:CBL-interacting serine/threonine-protein kinase 21 isoform X4 n=1 Tax=Sander lucioperca TaxID=283035 RepID=UPI0016539679|nr:CBL-interacting serine/threonine-protein kinase 21 isoform X4 [Sander lucioperca]
MAYSTSTIAQGCFGKVYKEKYNDTWAAVKKVPHNLISKKDLERECEVYNKANHPNIVKLLGNINLRDGKWIIPLEFIFGEDLETTIFKTSKSKIQLTPSIKGTIIIGMCEGLLHLHSKDVVHQDLKPENIMVEHNTNRAVIIDLGLAKFFRYGLNSAVNMGNEAYSAPEVLQERGQRDQRSDVWAMGKIIAELCARVRLYTPTVCPAKIKETLLDQPYCHAVCRMVETDPTLRASMGGVISEIRKAGSAGIVPSAPVQKDHLKPPASQINVRNLSPSPVNRDPSPENRNPSPMNRAPSPFNRDPSPMNRAPSPFNRDPLPIKKAPSPFDRGPSPMNKAPSPFDRDPSPLKWECSPRPDFKALNPQAAMHLSPSPQRTEDINKHQALVPAGRTELTQDFMKMKLYQEAAKDLPCNLPTTGRVVIRHFEEKNGEVETWQQKEVVTRDGKIVEFNDIKFNGK